jgi:hypothetical protein
MAAGSCPSLTCSVSATGSMDPEGSALTYSWNWADGSPAGSGLTASHVYASAGARTAVLTVTDQQGGVGTTQLVLTPSGSTAPFASDTFARTLASGWGAANTGGVWTTGSAIRYSVKAGAGSVITKAGETNSAVLQAVSSSDTDFKGTFGTDKLASGNGSYITLIGRRVGTNREYQARLRARADGSVAIQLGLLNGSATVTVLRPEVVPSGVTVAGGGTVTARFQVTGTQPTALRLKVWPTGAAEPTAWQLTTTDSVAALQVPGSVGVQMYVSGSSTVTPVTLKVSNFSAQPAAGN